MMSHPHVGCVCHPHHHVVGICAFCLQERLVALAQQHSEEADVDDQQRLRHYYHHRHHHDSADDGDIDDECGRPTFHSHQSSISAIPRSDAAGNRADFHPGFAASSSYPFDCDAPGHRLHDSNARDRVSAYPVNGGYAEEAKKKQRNLTSQTPSSSRPSNASESDAKSLRQAIMGRRAGYGGKDGYVFCHDFINAQQSSTNGPQIVERKSKSKAYSWFSKPKSKAMNLSPISPLMQMQSSSCDSNPLKSPLHHILTATQAVAGRRSVASELVNYNGGGGAEPYLHHHHMHHHNIINGDTAALGISRHADLNPGDAAVTNIDKGNPHPNTSWISSLFHRKKGLKCKANDKAGENARHNIQRRRASEHASMEAGRLSWDGGKPNLKHVFLKELVGDEVGMKRSQQGTKMANEQAYDMKGIIKNGLWMEMPEDPALQKCKSVTCGRRSIAVEVAGKEKDRQVKKNGGRTMPSPVVMSGNKQEPEEMMMRMSCGGEHMVSEEERCCYGGADHEEERQYFPRSRSWGRVLSLSPLWGGFKYTTTTTTSPPPSAAAAAPRVKATTINAAAASASSHPDPAASTYHLPSPSPSLQPCHHRHLRTQCLQNQL